VWKGKKLFMPGFLAAVPQGEILEHAPGRRQAAKSKKGPSERAFLHIWKLFRP
jgi:hypothetical protein